MFQGQWVIVKILRSWGKLKQLLIQQLYELVKATIPINLLAALKYLPFQPGDWERFGGFLKKHLAYLVTGVGWGLCTVESRSLVNV